ncbi:Topology modulation protein [Carbonactinospora thermoautotrophica]|uniref:Topology modulation protein n=3 Tax=Carbonactinospora thermoautotrophica TaxID=1469144 RepID=A0A132MSA3_9ACTN|nr:topology modulation protein [Carbonactinospora thermoautotrophica]KWX00758.1 Topology modulation protein [Carbonactinospora thermoautotrophica]
MRRIAVIGCGGSGKTRLARRLGALLDVPVIHLDAVYYDSAWNALPQEKFAALQEELVAAPAWVIDGNYASTLPIRLKAADTVVFLDLPWWTCLWGIAQRQWRHDAGQHDQGVYNRITWGFVRYVLGYRRRMRPRVERLLAEHARGADVVVLRGRRAVRRFLTQVARATRAHA